MEIKLMYQGHGEHVARIQDTTRTDGSVYVFPLDEHMWLAKRDGEPILHNRYHYMHIDNDIYLSLINAIVATGYYPVRHMRDPQVMEYIRISQGQDAVKYYIRARDEEDAVVDDMLLAINLAP